MTRLLVQIVCAAAVGLMAGCVSKPLEGPSLLSEAITLEQRSIRAAQSQDFLLADNLAAEALDIYSVLDNRDGQMRLLTQRTRLAIQGGLEKRARKFLLRARALARKEDREGRAELAMLAGHISKDGQEEYEQALALTEDPLRRAVAMTYLGRHADARILVEKADPETRREFDDVGFVLYENASARTVPGDAELALQHYKTAENILGISDSLFLLGKLADRAGDKAAARDYYGRALAVNQRLGDKRRIAKSEQALAAAAQ